MKAIYPGSFHPWHDGHLDVLKKALMVFKKIYVCRLVNPDKSNSPIMWEAELPFHLQTDYVNRVEVICYDGLLKNIIDKLNVDCIIKGLRNHIDLEYERTQQYWNEDLGLVDIPFFYVISDRNYLHVSSSAIRTINQIKKSKEK